MTEYNFAFLDEKNIVINILVFDSENPDVDFLNLITKQEEAADYKSCTVYGETFVGALFFDNRFIYQQPYPSWILNTETYEWESPIGGPVSIMTTWDEETLSWIPITPIE